MGQILRWESLQLCQSLADGLYIFLYTLLQNTRRKRSRVLPHHRSSEVISGLGNPRKLPALLTGSFEHVERFRNLKFAVIRITDIQSTVLSSSKGITAIHLAFK